MENNDIYSEEQLLNNSNDNSDNNDDDKKQSFDDFWFKLKEKMKYSLPNKEIRKNFEYACDQNIFVTRSDAEYEKNNDFNKYIEESKEIINNALRDDATETDDEKLTEHLKKVGINKFRYKFKEKDKNDDIEEYSYSFEEDKVVVIIRDDYGEIIRFEEFNYRDCPKELFFTIIEDLSKNDEDSVFFEKNKFNVSIANTVLKYFLENVELLKIAVEGTSGCNVTSNNCSMIEPLCAFMNKTNFKFSKALVKTMVEIADYETVQYFITNFGGIDESMQEDMLKNALINKDLNVITMFLNEKFKNYKNIISVFTNSTNIGVDLVRNLLADCNDRNRPIFGFNLIESFRYITDPRIAKVVFSELLSNNHDFYNIEPDTYYHNFLFYIRESKSVEVMQYILSEMSKTLTMEQISSMIIDERSNFKIFDLTVMNNNTDMIKFLLSIPGVDLDKLVKGNPDLLCYAAENNNTEIVELLLTNDKTDVDIPGEDGRTPLYVAVLNGNTEIIKMLFAKQPDLDINKRDTFYPDVVSPLELATTLNNREVIECLLEQQANYTKKRIKDINYRQNENNKQNPIIKSVNDYSMSQFKKDYNESKDYDNSLSTSANINKNKHEEDLLYQAILDKNTEMVEFLLSRDRVNIEVLSNINGESPLYTAVLKGNTEIVRLLLTKDIIWMNKPDIKGKTPLHLAIENGNIEIIKMLFAKQPNLDINKRDTFYHDVESPLELATRLNNREVIECLLEQRADYIKKEIKDIDNRQKEINKQYLILKNFKMENIIDYFMSQFKENNDKSKNTGI